jgi:hypothetical protein
MILIGQYDSPFVRLITEAHGDAFAHSYPALRARSERCEALDIFKSVVQPLYNPL